MTEEPTEQLDRRAAIKKAAIAGAAVGAVWSAPKIEGLSLRPNYAAAQTGPAPQNWSAFLSFSGSAPFENLFTGCVVNSGSANASGGSVSANVSGSGLGAATLTIDRYDASGGAVGGTFDAPATDGSFASAFVFTARPAGGMLPFPLVLKGTFNCG